MRRTRRSATLGQLGPLALVLLAAVDLRVLAAVGVQRFVDRHDAYRLCVFPDARYYWLLARTIREDSPYEIVEWDHVSYRAIRTPAYPLFLAACQEVFGEVPVAVRLVQAVLGTVSVWLVYRLARQVDTRSEPDPVSKRRFWTVPLIAAALAACYPYLVAMSELILSEALFMPLMLLTLWGLATLWRASDEPEPPGGDFTAWRTILVAMSTGLAGGVAVLTRPSWGLFLPVALLVWVMTSLLSRDPRRRRAALGGAALILTGMVLVMAPWWARNAQIYGRFVPTALWMGASLYDGLNPGATGASDMSFRDEPEFRELTELEQDTTLTRRALDFARSHPRRVLELALIKIGRYWSPWPNAEDYRSPWLAVASAVVVIPLYLLMVAGAWDRRRDLRALVLLAGPVLYFCAVHSVFVSSIRYRIPGEIAVMPLAAIGLRSILGRVRQEPLA
jgi:4-amino-4-deoxy-L-arabinose transferase-like glycosyltransferase